MKSLFLSFLVFLFFISSYGNTFQDTIKNNQELPTAFDESREPQKDLVLAMKIAKKEKKRILLDVGGEWCIWCKRLDQFLKENEDLSSILQKHFVIVKVNYSKDNKNEKFLSKYPKVAGYPHIFVLDKKGKLLHSQNTAELEEGKGYSHKAILKFLNKWKGK